MAKRPADLPGSSGVVRVMCVDDHAVLVEGLKAQFSLDPSLKFVGHLLSADELLARCTALRPNVVLLDIEMPGADVFEMADRLHRALPEIRFIFLSAHVRDGFLAAAYKCGASGYFSKGDDVEAIADAVREVGRGTDGGFIMGPKVQARCVPAARRTGGVSQSRRRKPKPTENGKPRTLLETLSARELEVLRLIGKGRTRAEIAAELSRSVKTIDGHQEHLMAKLRVHSRAELMRLAIHEGLVEL